MEHDPNQIPYARPFPPPPRPPAGPSPFKWGFGIAAGVVSLQLAIAAGVCITFSILFVGCLLVASSAARPPTPPTPLPKAEPSAS